MYTPPLSTLFSYFHGQLFMTVVVDPSPLTVVVDPWWCIGGSGRVVFVFFQLLESDDGVVAASTSAKISIIQFIEEQQKYKK